MNATSFPIPPVAQHVVDSLGYMLIGGFFSAILYGVILRQSYTYVRTQPTDPIYIRILVVLIFILQTFEIVLIAHSSYVLVVTNFANLETLGKSCWSIQLVYLCAALATITAQIFFACRVGNMSMKYKIAAAMTGVFFAVKLGISIYITVNAVLENTLNFLGRDTLFLSLSSGAGLFADLALTGSLLSVLRRGRANRTINESMVDKFMVYVVNTGALIAVGDGLTVIFACTLRDTTWWAIPSLVSTRLCATTFFSVLNSRKFYVTQERNIVNASMLGNHAIARANRLATIERWNLPTEPEDTEPAMIDIKVTTEVEGEGEMEVASSVEGHLPKAAIE